MKRLIVLLSIVGIAIGLVSCQKAPELTLTGPSTVEIGANGGSGSITFTANRDWSVRSSESWVSISPSSGTASDGTVTVSIRCDENTTYEDRSATITITMEELSQTVTVKQPANLGIVIPTKSYDLASDARSIEVEVQSNVQYTVSISDNWIKQTGTKGLTANKLIFSVDENSTYDARSATITIKPQYATVQEQVISVKQAQKDALTVEKTSFDMPYGGGEIEVKVEANVSFDVKPSVDWIHYVETKALSSSTVRLTVDENETYSAREGKIEIKQKSGTLSHSLTVKQAGRIAVTSIELNKTSLTLKEGESETLTATVKPDNATDKTVTWSSSNTGVATVDDAGNVTAIAKGESTITAVAGEIYAFCNITCTSISVPEAIDLGLSVAWGSFNLGAKKPEEYGDRFAWGETEPKTDYSWDSYKWGTADLTEGSYMINKYYPKDISASWWSGSGAPDGKMVLDAEDDAANSLLGGEWRMPRKSEFDELLDRCSWTWTELNGVKGYVVESKSNSNSIFLPTEDGEGYYWSSSLFFSPESSYSLFVNSSTCINAYERCHVFPIRAVQKIRQMEVTSITLKTSLTILLGDSQTLFATTDPDYAKDSIIWSSSDTSVATVDKNGTVNTLKTGNTIITATAGDKSATCNVNVVDSKDIEAVDLGLSVKWRGYNLGATRPEEKGEHYAWGEIATKEDYNWATYKWANGAYNKLTKYCIYSIFWDGLGDPDNKSILDPEDDVVQVKLGGTWRMPTPEEQKELLEQCIWTWTILNGTKGYIIESKVEGNTNSIFMPEQEYWSSTLEPHGDPWALSLFSTSVFMGAYERYYGFYVRPVSD